MIIPDFNTENCVSFVACGHAQTDDGIKRLNESKFQVISKFHSDPSYFVRLFNNHRSDDENSDHLHFEAQLSDFFYETPTTNADIAEITDELENYLGYEFNIHFKAAFEIPKSELPSSGIIKTFSKSIKNGDISFQLQSASVSLGGLNASEIQWKPSRVCDENIEVSILEDVVVEIDENYLETALKKLSEARDLLVLQQI